MQLARWALRRRQRLRTVRERAGLSQEELAGDRCTKSLVSKIESGRALPSIETLAYFAKQLRIDLGETVPANV